MENYSSKQDKFISYIGQTNELINKTIEALNTGLHYNQHNKNNKTISAAQIQKELGFKSRTSVQRILTKMLSDSKIKKSGTGKNTVYYFEE